MAWTGPLWLGTTVTVGVAAPTGRRVVTRVGAATLRGGSEPYFRGGKVVSVARIVDAVGHDVTLFARYGAVGSAGQEVQLMGADAWMCDVAAARKIERWRRSLDGRPGS